ncbi:hypothetical protein Slin14017_G064150 [Septoria linicola]|nr:hypothetical protein Slin14017_G064150 [Septoria linicola]
MEERLRRIQEENAARIRKEEEEARIRAEQKAKQLRYEEEARRRDHEEKQRALKHEEAAESTQSSPTPITAATLPETSSSAPATPAEKSSTLPSHAEQRRSDLQKRASKILDELLVKASIIGQQVNQYTGTDYSGIEALRKEISDQEQKVRSLRRSVDDARNIHHDAYAQQTASQREIVALLERKSSWSPTDLERYMSLVRSEHLNEQSVSSAKQNLDAAENNLEEARSLLERLERKQYHEEQIWSDTIRRNSTWVTFGLMGFNIILLLANIVIFEPYRRKKIAKDVKGLLDEKTLTGTGTVVVEGKDQGTQTDAVELKELEDFEALKKAEQEQPLYALLTAKKSESKKTDSSPIASGEMLPLEASEVIGAVPGVSEEIAQDKTAVTQHEVSRTGQTTWEHYQETFRDLFSDRVISMRKVDITNIALQGAASGFAIMGLLFVLLRPK